MIRLVSLNIERSKHLETVIPFLQKEEADIMSLQELMEYDIPRLERELGVQCAFAPSKRHQAEGKPGVEGIGILSRTSAPSNVLYYRGDALHIRDFDASSAAAKNATSSAPLLFCNLVKGESAFKVATTHFTWTPDGEPDDFQRKDMKSMLAALSGSGEFILCGDFNAPRGGEIFSMLAEKYKDNIPPEYKTSIDVNLHRAGHSPAEKMDEKMVDGLFSTPSYKVSDVRLEFGVSDHAAIVANIETESV